MKKERITDLISALLLLLFLYTALSKLLDMQGFREQVHLQVLPAWAADLLVLVLPPMELLAAGLLFFHKTRLAGFCLAGGLLVLFTGYVALVLLHAFGSVPCSCGGVLKTMNWQTHLYFNLAFTLLSLAGIALTYSAKRAGNTG